ncbi:MAG: nucleotidyltransferase domain-containing protein [Eubacteriales bacterium]|nr:nucleotidyltransferase domain-containing protein [Eubacteriales bacterium]
MIPNDQLKLIIDRIVDLYRNVYGDKIVSIILYGSYANGTANEYSDIDLVAIVSGSRDALQNDIRKIWEITADMEIDYGVILSPTVIPYDEFEKYKHDIPYYRNIDKDGIRIVA